MTHPEQTANPELVIGVIADDFTGAMDTGVMFAEAGCTTHFHLSVNTPNPDTPVVVVSTNSREASAGFATAQVKQAVKQLPGRKLFKKIDSTMRGHTSDEIEALLSASGMNTALICPAAVEVGRTVENGLVLVNGEPLHKTAFADDPHWPASTASITKLMRREAVVHLGHDIVGQGAGALRDAVRRAGVALVTVDATTQSDLDTIAQAAVDGGYLPCGSKGLAQAWARSLGACVTRTLPPFAVPKPPRNGPLVIVAGSRHPVSNRQLAVLAQERNTGVFTISPEADLLSLEKQIAGACEQQPVVILRTPVEKLPSDRLIAVNTALAKLVRSACEASELSGLVLIGGETAAKVCQLLEADGIWIIQEVEAGIPFGWLLGGAADTLPVVTKAGGFGTDQSLVSIVTWLQGSITR